MSRRNLTLSHFSVSAGCPETQRPMGLMVQKQEDTLFNTPRKLIFAKPFLIGSLFNKRRTPVKFQGSEYDICEGRDHILSLRCFPTDFLCSSKGLAMEAVAPLSSNFIRLVGGVGLSHGVIGCRGDDRRQDLAIFRGACRTMGSLVVRASDSRSEGRGSMPPNTLRVNTEYVLVKSVLWMVTAETKGAGCWRIFPSLQLMPKLWR
ncbi:hypothetical protein TNCV_4878371 [Trichonephila clavipes]|nr:hypothetical protein TNCV_4878371 [Trichonephila clavipes]